MTALWVSVIAIGCTAIIIAVSTWRHRIDMAELGTVSQQWLAEQRANERHMSGHY